MSKRDIHVNKWSRWGGYYYRENGYYSKKAVREAYPQGNDEENHYIYYHRIYGNTRLLLKTCFKLIIEDVHIAIIQKRKKYKK